MVYHVYMYNYDCSAWCRRGGGGGGGHALLPTFWTCMRMHPKLNEDAVCQPLYQLSLFYL